MARAAACCHCCCARATIFVLIAFDATVTVIHAIFDGFHRSDPARSEWCIGSKGGGGARAFVGHIADVQLWSVALTPAHVTSLVNEQGSSIPRPVARWMLDDESGVKQAQVCL